jgi:curved DNA-binding protein CbpA
LGFEPKEPLTKERVRARKQALARVYHPDLGAGGSEAQMKRINAAADALLAKLS